MVVSRLSLVIAFITAFALGAHACKSSDSPGGGAGSGGSSAGTGGRGGSAAMGGTGAGSGGATGDGGATGQGGVSGTPDAMVIPTTCREAEFCAFGCDEDQACAQRCPEKLAGAEKALWDALMTCRHTSCPDKNDMACRCDGECFVDGTCHETLDACMGGVDDPWCEMLCH